MSDWRPSTNATVVLSYNRITNMRNREAVLLNGLHQDPNISISFNEITNQFGDSQPTDAINIYRSSGLPGRPIYIHNNYVSGVVPANPYDTTFTGAGIVADGDTFDPRLATAHMDIGYNQVVGCVYEGIALAFGLHEIAHDNVIVSAGRTQYGTPVVNSLFGVCIEGDHQYQPAEWLQWLQLVNNSVSVNGWASVAMWYPSASGQYAYGNQERSFNSVTLADEQEQWTAWKSKLAADGVMVGP